jgi:4-hydroxy-tetrahydrodipicolinate reductase
MSPIFKGLPPIVSIRKDDVPGTHIIQFKNEIESIEIKHTAFSREGFAKGAVKAAEWIKDRKGIFSMQDVLRP